MNTLTASSQQPFTRYSRGRRLLIAARPYLLLVLLTAPALVTLLRPGFFVSDDGLFHVYRIAALAGAWEHGVLYPRLLPNFGFGYGQAVFNFYAPLSYWPGAALALLGGTPVLAAKLTIALGFVLAALAAYGYARYLWGPVGGVLAAVAYTYFPYHLADAYQRGAIPEHLAFLWLPLILWAYTAAFREARPRLPLLWGSLAWAGLIYTHNLTALLMAPTWLVYIVVLAAWTGHWRRLLPAATSAALGLMLSAPLWVPFVVESSAVGIGLGPSDGFQKHLIPLAQAVQSSLLYGFHVLYNQATAFPLSWLAVGVMFGAGLLLAWRLARREIPPAAPVLAFSLALTLGAGFMMTLPALPIWRPLTPLLGNLQYPWRFQTLVALGASGLIGGLPALLAGSARPTLAGPRWLAPLLSLLVLALILQPSLTLPYQTLALPSDEAWTPDRMWREDAEAGQVGATWTGEFLPLTVREQRWALGRSRADAHDGPGALPRPQVQITRLGYDQLELATESASPLTVRLHQFYLPAWQARLNGRPISTFPTDELGLVSAAVPNGAQRLAFQFGPTPAVLASGAIAILAVALWVGLTWRTRGKTRWASLMAAGLILSTVALGANGLGLGRQTWTPHPAQAVLGDVALLLGYDVAPARGREALDITLYWFALREVGTDLKSFVHLLDGNGQVIAQHDGNPAGGYTPTTRWRAGEVIPDRHRVILPAGGNNPASVEYGLKAGLYQVEPLRNLPTDPPTPDARVDLGSVRLVINSLGAVKASVLGTKP